MAKKLVYEDPVIIPLGGKAAGECLVGGGPTQGNSQCTDGSGAAGAGVGSGCQIGSNAQGHGCDPGSAAGGAVGCIGGSAADKCAAGGSFI